MSPRTSCFDRALREIAVPALSAHGFAFDGSRTFRRFSEHPRTCEIVNFQLGQRSMAGKFTVNLGRYTDNDSPGVAAERAREYDCRFERRARIGSVVPLRFPRLSTLPFIGFLFGGLDRWWRFSDDSIITDDSVRSAVADIVSHGLRWFGSAAA